MLIPFQALTDQPTTQPQPTMKRLVTALLIEIWPFKSFSYMERFAQTVQEINMANNRRMARPIHLIIWFQLIMALRQIVLGAVQWRPIDRIQLFDGTYLFQMGRETNLMISLLNLMAALAYRTVYLRVDRLLFSIITESM